MLQTALQAECTELLYSFYTSYSDIFLVVHAALQAACEWVHIHNFSSAVNNNYCPHKGKFTARDPPWGVVCGLPLAASKDVKGSSE